MRRYAATSAPLQRVRFRVGDQVQGQGDPAFEVREVIEEDGLLTYVGDERCLAEGELADTIGFAHPDDRLLSGRVDDSATFNLRLSGLRHRHQMRRSPLRGLLGGRIDLIPHQLYIAHEVSSRNAPRVLLSDEVGLGKTIEAGMILHRLHLNGRAGRILVLVPESLVHQWFVELLRRFNFWFNIFDEERCAAIEEGDPGANPFLDDQLVLASIDFLTENPVRGVQAVAAGWDLLVIDEAHHLAWSPDAPSSAYALVEAISRQAEGLLLLTATPEQLGQESHFARLRLLDPDRYVDLQAFLDEIGHGREVAMLADRLLSGRPLRTKDREILRKAFAGDAGRALEDADRSDAGDLSARAQLLDDLLDQHGPGRVIFRNARASMKGFPVRQAHLVALPSDDEALRQSLALELAADAGQSDHRPRYAFAHDPRLHWLAEFLSSHPDEKVLLICRFKEMALALHDALRHRSPASIAVFHEDLPLVQRDRQAAWFAEADGARILLCSEIGGEGRNFQFAHHLVLFDLPLDPELLEQRIGRLDRIGQTETIRIHIPYIERSAQEVLAHWYHEGLGAVESCLHGGHEFAERFSRRVLDLALVWHLNPVAGDLALLLDEGRRAGMELTQRMEAGRDRLLELTSLRASVADRLVRDIHTIHEATELDDFLLDLLGYLRVDVEEMAHRTYLVKPGPLQADALPGLPPDGLMLTADRQKALSREDIEFLSWDHPVVGAAIEMLLGSPRGNSSVAILNDGGGQGIFLETVFVLEAITSAHLHADRFMPPTPIRMVVDVDGDDVDDLPMTRLRDGQSTRVLQDTDVARTYVPRMLEQGRHIAESRRAKLVESALERMHRVLDHELHRLQGLRAAHGLVRQSEIDVIRAQRNELESGIAGARLRLDAVRLILRGVG